MFIGAAPGFPSQQGHVLGDDGSVKGSNPAAIKDFFSCDLCCNPTDKSGPVIGEHFIACLRCKIVRSSVVYAREEPGSGQKLFKEFFCSSKNHLLE